MLYKQQDISSSGRDEGINSFDVQTLGAHIPVALSICKSMTESVYVKALSISSDHNISLLPIIIAASGTLLYTISKALNTVGGLETEPHLLLHTQSSEMEINVLNSVN